MKVAIIGSRSFFVQNLAVDILNIQNLDEWVFALIDLDSNRKVILKNSDFIINQIEINVPYS